MFATLFALSAAFSGPSTRVATLRTHGVRLQEEADAPPTPMAPSFTLETDEPLNERYAKDYAAMGSMGAYMGIREDMARAFNTVDADKSGFIDEVGLSQLLEMIKYTGDVAASKQFADADAQSRGKITYEQWCKVFLDSSKPPEGEKKGFFGLF